MDVIYVPFSCCEWSGTAVPDGSILGLMWCLKRITGFSFVLVSVVLSAPSTSPHISLFRMADVLAVDVSA